MNDKKQKIIDVAFEALEKELEEKPLSPERLYALTHVITTLSETNSLL